MTDSSRNVSSNRHVFGYILLHPLPHGGVRVSVPISVAATQLVTAVPFNACCTSVRCQYFMDILRDTLDNMNRGCVYRRCPIIM